MLKAGKTGKHRNALTFPHSGLNIDSLPSYPSPLSSSTPVISRPGKRREKAEWLEEQKKQEEKNLAPTSGRSISHFQLVFDKYDQTVSQLLLDLAGSAHWNRWHPSPDRMPRILKKSGEGINGWGWVVYRVHSSGEAILPDQAQPSNYTLFNFWQVSFTNGHKPDLSPDLRTWHLHARQTLEDFERIMPGQVEKWLKEQLFSMFKEGCIWVGLPDLLNEKGKRRKPTIQDALHTYNLLSFGRNYDLFQTEAHFYDRPPTHNQFLAGFFKR